MKRLIYFTLCMCTMMVALSSCGGKDSKDNEESGDKKGRKNSELVGKWEQILEQPGIDVETIYDFKSNGRMKQTMSMSSESPYINIKGSAECKYTFEDGIITFKFSADDIDFSRFEIEGVSDDDIEAQMDIMKSQMGSMEQQITNVKIDGDDMTARFNGQPIKMIRI